MLPRIRTSAFLAGPSIPLAAVPRDAATGTYVQGTIDAATAGLLLSLYATHKVVNKAELKAVFPIVHGVAYWLVFASLLVAIANLARSA